MPIGHQVIQVVRYAPCVCVCGMCKRQKSQTDLLVDFDSVCADPIVHPLSGNPRLGLIFTSVYCTAAIATRKRTRARKRVQAHIQYHHHRLIPFGNKKWFANMSATLNPRHRSLVDQTHRHTEASRSRKEELLGRSSKTLCQQQ